MKVNKISPQECWQLNILERDEYHRQQLLALLEWVSREVPFYRRLHLPIEELKRLDLPAILESLPIVSKDMIRGRNPDFLSVNRIPGRWVKTGGSTCEPTEIFYDRGKEQRGKNSLAFARSWWNLRLGQKCFFIWGHGASLAPGWYGKKDRIVRPIKDFLRRRLRVSAYHTDQSSLRQYVQKLIRFQPEMIIAYTSTLYLLAQRFLMEGYNAKHLKNLRGIIVSCDPCYPYQAEVIQAAFGAPIIIEYGCMEVGPIAYSHPDGTLRILEDRLIVETPMGLGGLPEVIVTDLGSFGQPLIKFAMEDNVQKPIAFPPQGIGFRSLGPIEGRVFDMISGEGGRCLHGAALSDCVKSSYPDVLRYRFYQRADGFLRVELQLKPNANADARLEKHLLTFLGEELSPAIPIELVYVESFPQTLSGKFRMIVSEMPQAQRSQNNGVTVE